MKNKIELLAPAGNFEALKAAIFNGADAVYLGAAAFGARASAGFNNEELKKAVEFAHIFGIKIYVTLNILIKPNEIQSIIDVLKFLDNIKVDALIVQDIGLVRIIKENFPNFQIHASTQMSIHSLNGVLTAKKLGLDRVVLARECSLKDIKSARLSDCDIEVFIHGAQCVSVSGQCLMSSLTGGRSGNRGRCAQLCRLEYTYKGKRAAWLSPRDLSEYENIDSLILAGVSSLKIEGRLKSPEYVAIVTRAYREKIDAFYSKNELKPLFNKNDLIQAFNRGGFTEGYAFEKEDNDIIFKDIVSHYGVKIGTVKSIKRIKDIFIANIKLEKTLNDQDYLELRSAKSKQAIIYSGKETIAGSNAELRLRTPIEIGADVFRLTDSKLMKKAESTFNNIKKTIDISAKLLMKIDEPVYIEYSSQKSSFGLKGSNALHAEKIALTQDRVKEAVTKVADLPFSVSNIDITIDDNCFFPMSELNSLRRLAIDGLYNKILEDYERPKAINTHSLSTKKINKAKYSLFVESSNREFIDYVVNGKYENVKISYFNTDFRNNSLSKSLSTLDGSVALTLPHQLSDEELVKINSLVILSKRDVVINSLAALALNWPCEILAGSHLNVFNNESLESLEALGISKAFISRELNETEAKQAIQNNSNAIVPIYGRSSIMLLNHCPERVLRLLSSNRAKCRLCDNNTGTKDQFLVDRQGYNYPIFPIHFDDGCINMLLESKALNLLNKHSINSCIGVRFTIEKLDEQIKIFNYYYALVENKDINAYPNPLPYYCGRLNKGVE